MPRSSDVRAAGDVRNRNWMTAREVAEFLDVSERCVWTWSSLGRLPKPVRRGGKWTRWKRREIEPLAG